MQINISRLRTISNNIKESISDIDYCLKEIESNKKSIKRIAIYTNSIRLAIVQVREEIFKSVVIILKSARISVNNYTSNTDLFEECKKLGYFVEIPKDFSKKITDLRNNSCHRYKQPTLKEIINFYSKYRDTLIDIVDALDNIKNKDNTDTDYISKIQEKLANTSIKYTEETISDISKLIPESLEKRLGKTKEERAFNYLDIYIKYYKEK